VTFGRGLMGNCTYQLRVVEVATANDRLITESPTPFWSPTWSPGGDRIAYLAQAGQDPRGEDSGLWLVDAAGGEPVLLSDAIGNVHWSPDGSWMSFERLSTTRTEGDRADLWAMPLDGGEPQLIAEHAAGGW
jgi:Tol biopolymer transport system component